MLLENLLFFSGWLRFFGRAVLLINNDFAIFFCYLLLDCRILVFALDRSFCFFSGFILLISKVFSNFFHLFLLWFLALSCINLDHRRRFALTRQIWPFGRLRDFIILFFRIIFFLGNIASFFGVTRLALTPPRRGGWDWGTTAAWGRRIFVASLRLNLEGFFQLFDKVFLFQESTTNFPRNRLNLIIVKIKNIFLWVSFFEEWNLFCLVLFLLLFILIFVLLMFLSVFYLVLLLLTFFFSYRLFSWFDNFLRLFSRFCHEYFTLRFWCLNVIYSRVGLSWFRRLRFFILIRYLLRFLFTYFTFLGRDLIWLWVLNLLSWLRIRNNFVFVFIVKIRYLVVSFVKK